jgi:hypothetical protein
VKEVKEVNEVKEGTLKEGKEEGRKDAPFQ